MNYYKLTKRYKDDSLFALRKFLTIPSVYDKKTSSKTKPYGKYVDEALKYIGELGERYGFEVDYCDGRATELTYGEGEKLISIYAHADVVPATGDWIHPPFEGNVDKKKVYGRGASDDKGPLIAALYSIKALKDAGLIRGYKVRLVAGGDEERGSTCLKYYFDELKKEQATYGFTPDSDFPLIYGEKGISCFDASIKVNTSVSLLIEGGIVYNAVNDLTTIRMKENDAFIDKLHEDNVKYELVEKNGEHLISIIGKSAHGSTPKKGVNAALIALKELGEFFNIEEFKKVASMLASGDGKPFDGYAYSKELKETTYCVGLINYKNGVLNLGVNMRYPENTSSEVLLSKFKDAFSAEIKPQSDSLPLLFDKKSKMIKAMVSSYRKETGDASKPFTIGGGTYAKSAKNTVAFGATFPGKDNLIHSPNEYLDLRDFYLMQAIYARAIHKLGKMK